MRILIADDDSMSLRLLEKTRERAGFEVTAVDNGRKALEEMCCPEGSLTSLLNRGTIIELLAREFARTRRENRCTTVVIGDLDHFKLVNDTHGHPVGDEVLREVGRRLLGSVRSYDFVGRYGGEEFLLVLNNCGADKALVRADQIRCAVSSLPISTSKGSLSITLSVGGYARPRDDQMRG